MGTDERLKDPRNIADLYNAFENADFIVRKRYRADLDKYPVCDLPKWIENVLPVEKEKADEDDPVQHVLGDNVQFMKVEKIVYDESENTLDKLTTVYHTMASFSNTSVIMLLFSDGQGVEIYLGVAERFDGNNINENSRGNKRNTLKTVFESNFPGSSVATIIDKKPINQRVLIDKIFNDKGVVSNVTGIASQRNKDIRENEQFVQGIEKLIDAMRGKEFSAVFIADCKSVSEIEDLCAKYEDIYSKLSPFEQSQQTIGRTDSVTDTESFIKGVTDTTNESVADSISHSHTIGKSSSNTAGGSVTVGGSSGFLPGPNASASVNYSHTWGKNESDTDTNTKTTTTGTAKSLTEQNSVAKAISVSTNDGLQISFQNRAVKTLLERIDEQIKHLRACEAYGIYDFSCYFLAKESSVSIAAANIYDSLMRGDESSSEVSSVNTWVDDNAERAIEYLKRFYHPLIALPNLSKPNKENPNLYEILPVTPSTIISGKEIALHMGLPKKSVSGIPVTECADFGRNVCSLDKRNTEEGIKLGEIYHMQKPEETEVKLDRESLTMHTFVTGSTGSGKSNTVYQLLGELRNGEKFLVIEPAKGEYRAVFGGKKGVYVYGTNPKLTNLLRINPFSFPNGIHIYEHMDRLVEIFNVCWPMYAAMPAILKDAIERAYIGAGWNLKTSENKYNDSIFPNFADVLREIDTVMNESQYSSDSKGDYKGALATRLRSLTNGINGMIFTSDEISNDKLFDENVVVDLSRVASTETKSMIMGLLIMKLQEHRMTSGEMNSDLKHITVLEEAHNLLKRTSTEQSSEGSNLLGKSVEMLTNAIAEMRTYGEGFIIADQAPGLLDMGVIRNTNTKIVLRLPEYSDRELVGKAMGLNDEQIVELARLEKGVAAVYQNDWINAVLCKINHYTKLEPIKPSAISLTDRTEKFKNVLFDAIVSNKLHKKIEWIDKNIITVDMPANLKCALLDYKNKNHRDFSALSKIAYEFFNSESVFANMPKDSTKFAAYAKKAIIPSVDALTEAQMQFIITMITQEHILRHPEQQAVLESLCRRVR